MKKFKIEIELTDAEEALLGNPALLEPMHVRIPAKEFYDGHESESTALEEKNLIYKTHDDKLMTCYVGLTSAGRAVALQIHASRQRKFLNEFDRDRAGTGTNEWSEHSYNICTGCFNNCVYCYARENALRRSHAIADAKEWTDVKIDMNKVNKKWKKVEGIIMFPTAHDILPSNVKECITTLVNMLSAGNRVLIVSKPRIEVIKELCNELQKYKDQIMFRFTIGSTTNHVLSILEPGAPLFEERLSALKHAHGEGYRTSVSAEPLLGGLGTLTSLYNLIAPYVTDSIWVGKMNKIDQRVNIDSPALDGFIMKIKLLQADPEILNIVRHYKGRKYIKWKDSIKEVVDKYNKY